MDRGYLYLADLIVDSSDNAGSQDRKTGGSIVLSHFFEALFFIHVGERDKRFRMSHRKGGAHKVKRKTLNLDADSHAALVSYAQSKKIQVNIIIAEFIAKGVEHDIHDPDWIEKLLKADDVLNKYARLDGACPALAGGRKSNAEWLYRCVWFRPDAPPNIKNLGDSEELKDSACLSCDGTRPYVEGLKERDERIAELEVQLGEKSSERFKIPKCNQGADLRHDKDDQLVFHNCQKHRHAPVSVAKFCKVYSGGLPCASFTQITVGVSS